MIWLLPRRLDWALRTRGTDLSRWPEDERQAAFGLLRRSDTARTLLADALASDPAPEPDADDMAAARRLRARLAHALRPSPPVWRGARWGALAASAAAGLYIGLLPIEPDASEPGPTVQATAPSVLATLDR